MLISRGNSLIRIFTRPILHRPQPSPQLNRACTIATFFVNPSERHRVEAPCALPRGEGRGCRDRWKVSEFVHKCGPHDARVPGVGRLGCRMETASACPLHSSSPATELAATVPYRKGVKCSFLPAASRWPPPLCGAENQARVRWKRARSTRHLAVILSPDLVVNLPFHLVCLFVSLFLQDLNEFFSEI